MMRQKSLEAGILNALQDQSEPFHAELLALPDWIGNVSKTEKLIIAFSRSTSRKEWEDYLVEHPPSPQVVAILINELIDRINVSRARRGGVERNRRNVKRKKELQGIWLSGRYKTKKECAAKEHERLGIQFETAKKWLNARFFKKGMQKEASA
jgi:hypothetical protein